MDTTAYQTLRVFLSSPGDVADERNAASDAIKEVSQRCCDALGVTLEPWGWEVEPPMTSAPVQDNIQKKIDQQITNCHIFVLILARRYGTASRRGGVTHTEGEVNLALKLLKDKKKIMFLAYFKKLKGDCDLGPQERKVRRFRERLGRNEIWHKEYTDVRHFRELLIHDLYRTVMRFKLSDNRKRALSRFWQFGMPQRNTHPKLAIVYPVMGRALMGCQNGTQIWVTRLEPNIVFEDFKAIQKIEKNLRLIGFRDYRIYNSANLPADVNFMNRLWICLPRSYVGLEQLAHYRSVTRFELNRKRNHARSTISWMPRSGRKRSVLVRSPLSTYLRQQRSNLQPAGEWHPQMDNIVAKDYAVLARFADVGCDTEMEDGQLHDYFLSGIRGLGTWGAAWFIDRKYRAFDRIGETKDYQLLLEVEYRSGRIHDVLDVSDKPQEYFDAQNSNDVITDSIRRYRQATGQTSPGRYRTESRARQ